MKTLFFLFDEMSSGAVKGGATAPTSCAEADAYLRDSFGGNPK
jgi:hypothetical protein